MSYFDIDYILALDEQELRVFLFGMRERNRCIKWNNGMSWKEKKTSTVTASLLSQLNLWYLQASCFLSPFIYLLLISIVPFISGSAATLWQCTSLSLPNPQYPLIIWGPNLIILKKYIYIYYLRHWSISFQCCKFLALFLYKLQL